MCSLTFLGGICHFAMKTVSCWSHGMINLFTHFCCQPGHGCVSFSSQLQATHLGTLMFALRTVWFGHRRLNTRTKLLCWLGRTRQHVLKLSGATCSVHMRRNILGLIPVKSPLSPFFLEGRNFCYAASHKYRKLRSKLIADETDSVMQPHITTVLPKAILAFKCWFICLFLLYEVRTIYPLYLKGTKFFFSLRWSILMRLQYDHSSNTWWPYN